MNWTDSENTLRARTWTFGLYGKLNPGPETGLKAQKFGFKARTKYGVYKYAFYLFVQDAILRLIYIIIKKYITKKFIYLDRKSVV